MPASAPKKLHVNIKRPGDRRASYTFSIDRTIVLEPEFKLGLAGLVNSGRYPCHSSNPKEGGTIIEVVITRGCSNDAALVYFKMRKLLDRLAEYLRMPYHSLLLDFAEGSMQAMSLSEFHELLEGVHVTRHAETARKRRVQQRPGYTSLIDPPLRQVKM